MFVNAIAAVCPLAKAPPELNPNHPNNKIAPPRDTKPMFPGPFLGLTALFPKKNTAANAPNPAVICITVPPA